MRSPDRRPSGARLSCRWRADYCLAAPQALVQPLRRRSLEGHVAVVARPQPGAVERRPGRLIEIRGGSIHPGIAPGAGMARLAAGGDIGPGLYLAARDPEGEIGGGGNLVRKGRDADSRAAQSRTDRPKRAGGGDVGEADARRAKALMRVADIAVDQGRAGDSRLPFRHAFENGDRVHFEAGRIDVADKFARQVEGSCADLRVEQVGAPNGAGTAEIR